MAATLNDTPASDRLHIGFFGKRNTGKSSLINAFINQQVSIVSDVAGTTTDPVFKSMEISPLGPCIMIDTAGFDDEGELGEIRVEKAHLAAEKTELAVIVCTDCELSKELKWYQMFRERQTPVLFVVNKTDILEDAKNIKKKIEDLTGQTPLLVSAKERSGIEDMREAFARLLPENCGRQTITGNLLKENDLVLLIMPQDIQAPKGRLILPQVQTIRELLDKKCLVMSVTADKMTEALENLKQTPKLIITDSQAFSYVFQHKPKESLLTSFSVLFAAYKGDLSYYMDGAKQIDQLTGKSKVLIAECCTHAPLSEDIGREKIPRMLRKRAGEGISVDIVSGTDYPKDLSEYDLIIQCGACMFNRKYVMARIERAKKQHVPMTNYGVAIAYLTGILPHIAAPQQSDIKIDQEK